MYARATLELHETKKKKKKQMWKEKKDMYLVHFSFWGCKCVNMLELYWTRRKRTYRKKPFHTYTREMRRSLLHASHCMILEKNKWDPRRWF